MTLRKCLLATLIALAACSPMAADAGQKSATSTGASARHPVSGLEVIPLAISSAKGRYTFQVEVARSDAEWSKGLMFRTEMGADEGMIFVGRAPQMASFWMKNTVIPLDIVFIGTDRRIINIVENAVPYSLEPRSSAGITLAVLELNGGRAAQLGIAPGDKVAW